MKASDFESLHEKGVLQWKPWIGNGYQIGGLMVVGESNYADADDGKTLDAAVAEVNGNWNFTQDVVELFCISRKQPNRTFDGITYLLKPSEDNVADVSFKVWHSIAYMDVIQCAMKGKGYGGNARQRPADNLWKPGWSAVAEVIKVLRPSRLLFVGSELAYHSTSRFMPRGRMSANIRNACNIGRLWLRDGFVDVDGIGKLPVLSIPNPASA